MSGQGFFFRYEMRGVEQFLKYFPRFFINLTIRSCQWCQLRCCFVCLVSLFITKVVASATVLADQGVVTTENWWMRNRQCLEKGDHSCHKQRHVFDKLHKRLHFCSREIQPREILFSMALRFGFINKL